jgi:hypothetical protein
MRWGQRRRVLSAEETAANAAERAKREKAGMHCQCCGRKYLANTGTIAHHGYMRPGGGWQTASCMGAKYEPFEVDRARLGELIDYLTSTRIRMRKSRAAVKAETVPIIRSYNKRNPARGWDRPDKIDVELTRATIDAQKKAHPGLHLYGDFDGLKIAELSTCDRELKNIGDEILHQQDRYDGWKQTHGWNRDSKTWTLRRIK